MQSRMAGLAAVGMLALSLTAGAGQTANASAVALLRPANEMPNIAVRSAAGARLLYSQLHDVSLYRWQSADYPQKAAKKYDSQIANQFTVPKAQTWMVSEVVAAGLYTDGTGGPGGAGGPATSENVHFFKNAVNAKKQDVPGALIRQL